MSKGKPAARYAVKLDASDEAKGYQRVSLVAKPAIQRGWVALSEAPMPAKRVHLSTEPQKQVLTGPALIPDENILRLNEAKEPYYIYFSAETIEQIAHKLMQEGRTTDTNEEHSVTLSGNVVRELWIVADPEKDKAAALGIDVPAGTLMMSVHIADSATWEKVQDGTLTGFSIEGLFDFEEVQLSAVEAPKSTMKKNWFFTALAALAAAAGVKLTKVELQNGDIVDVAEDGTVSALDADGNITGPAADGEYELADGTKLTVKDGKKAEAVAMAGAFAVGDSVTPKAGMAHMPEHEGLVMTIAEIDGDFCAVRLPDGSTHKWYKMSELDAATSDSSKSADSSKTADAGMKMSEVKPDESVKLEAISMADGQEFTLNPITRLLTDSTGKYVPTGYYACADGSYFKVNLDQYTYSIDKETYDRSLKLSAVETELKAEQAKVVELTEQLSKEPAAGRVRLSGEGEAQPKTAAQLRLARAEARR